MQYTTTPPINILNPEDDHTATILRDVIKAEKILQSLEGDLKGTCILKEMIFPFARKPLVDEFKNANFPLPLVSYHDWGMIAVIGETQWIQVEVVGAKRFELAAKSSQTDDSPLEIPPHESFALRFDEVSIINRERCIQWHGENGIEDWTVSDWAMATAGEFGELCNVLKKLNRRTGGLQGNSVSDNPINNEEDMMYAIQKEIGGTYLYLDLLCQRLGIRIQDAVRMEFNRVSERLNFPQRIK